MASFQYVTNEEARSITGHSSYDRFRWWIWHHNKKYGHKLPIYRRRGYVDKLSLTRALKALHEVANR